MEYLDIYDENGKHLGKEDRNIVHEKGLWHNTVHCWLYDKFGNIYFQIRAEEKTFYTTASGHVAAGESIKEAFGREIYEEIGLKIDYEKAVFVNMVTWKMDRENKDGTFFIDRAFANVYVFEYEENIEKFNFDLNEVDGVVKVNAKEALLLLEDELKSIDVEAIKTIDGKNIKYEEEVVKENFLINMHETYIGKYGDILNKIIELTNI